MDEVDDIIIHSLRQIDCKIDDEITSLSSFTPELTVETVAKCLQLIKPSANLPKTLPPGMAQRFTATAMLCEACVSAGYRGDLGYQTFLYSNVTDVRRLFMFLIERLPKETEKLPLTTQPLDKLTSLENEISRNLNTQLTMPWVPQYCNRSGIRKYNSSLMTLSANGASFQPNLFLNIPDTLKLDADAETTPTRLYWASRSPSVFQQTNSKTLCASTIHKNDLDLQLQVFGQPDIKSVIDHLKDVKIDDFKSDRSKLTITPLENREEITQPSSKLQTAQITTQPSIPQLNLKPRNALEELNLEIEILKKSIEELLTDRKSIQEKILRTKEETIALDKQFEGLQHERKIQDRTCILLENPEVNIVKMQAVLSTSREKIQKLHTQWEEHRKPLIEALEKSQQKNSSKNSEKKSFLDQVLAIRAKAADVTEDLKNKSVLHAHLVNELKKVDRSVSRNAYTSRILEIIGNIRKQQADIDKVLRDTRELQKEINTISGQLDRQFTVTDDLLFKYAKRDENSKKAYKLLATLHTDFSDLVSLVQETGANMREIRDIEDQIEVEKARNIAINLEKITSDLKQMEKDSKDLQEKIRKVENQITQG